MLSIFKFLLNSLPVIFFSILLLGISLANAQSAYPNRPIKFIAPFPPGGTSDVIGRIMAQKMGDALGQPVIVENKVGSLSQPTA